jgi:hypothetical protein
LKQALAKADDPVILCHDRRARKACDAENGNDKSSGKQFHGLLVGLRRQVACLARRLRKETDFPTRRGRFIFADCAAIDTGELCHAGNHGAGVVPYDIMQA